MCVCVDVDFHVPRTMWCKGGVSSLWNTPWAPLGAALSPGAHAELVVHVGVQVHHQELRLLADVGVLILCGVAPAILQAVVLRAKVIVHLQGHKRVSSSARLTLQS